MGSLSHNFYGKLEIPVENVKQFYIYAGSNAMQDALDMARRIKMMTKNTPVSVVACDCKWAEKKEILADTDIPLLMCECGGQSFLGDLAEKILAS